jgi:predicted nucleic acid-binding protein
VANKGVLLDTGPLTALLCQRDQYHTICTAAAKELGGPFFTCWPVITETAYLLRQHGEQIDKLFELIRSTKIRLLHLDVADINGLSQILTQFSDQEFDLADVALMHVANREAIETVFTIDRRHFSVYRLPRGNPLSLIPEVL